MNITNIALVDTDTVEAVTARMSLPEVVFLATLLGRMTWMEQNEVMPGGAEAADGIYDGVVSVLNRFYEDGTADALRSLAGGAA